MKRFPPNGNPRLYTLSSLVIGYFLIDSFTANEQNAIGNWLMTIGQILEENCAFQQVMEERIQGNTVNINSHQFKRGGSPYMHNPPLYPRDRDEFGKEEAGNNNDSSPDTNDNETYKYTDELDSLKKAIQIMQDKLDELTKK